MEIPVEYPPIEGYPTPGEALWNQRAVLAQLRGGLQSLIEAVDQRQDFIPEQWIQLMAFALEFRPDCIVELGRGRGNSTCALTTVANQLGSASVVSLCQSSDWRRITLPRVRECVPSSWEKPLEVVEGDIRCAEPRQLIGEAKRVFVFWDAHGYEVAEWVLGALLPELASREHLVVMHDVQDARFVGQKSGYDGHRLWTGNSWAGERLFLGPLTGSVEQLVAIVDFVSRNKITLRAAEESLWRELDGRRDRCSELDRLLGPEFFSGRLRAHWLWFSLRESAGPLTFPSFNGEPSLNSEVLARIGADLARGGWLARVRVALKLLTDRYARSARRALRATTPPAD